MSSSAIEQYKHDGNLLNFYHSALAECRDRKSKVIAKLNDVDPLDTKSVNIIMEVIEVSLRTEVKILQALKNLENNNQKDIRSNKQKKA